MKHRHSIAMALVLVGWLGGSAVAETGKDYWKGETPTERASRMEWWQEARFGMFIHWGLYAIPAGEWKGKRDYAEWIRTRARIPIDTYDRFVGQFNPVKFDADGWVRMAKRAGMKYIVITSKHHDGFCLWPSKVSAYDVEATPFKRDILGELTEACRKHGVRMCFYHSIMDWHHPDYLPRRKWEAKDRPNGDADYNRYVTYMKSQLSELVQAYHPGVMWFDGEWEGTWTHEHGKELYQYVRSLDPEIIINNRVDKGRRGMEGLTRAGEYRGDFGTPEQRIPAEGLPGVDWESCMTMNRKWGWNKADTGWKSATDLIRKLADIASKGGNFLLNIGPKPDGTFPDKAIERLAAIGQWMDTNADAIYGTGASPIGLPAWGRCTSKALDNGNTRLYLHIFDWPASGALSLPLGNKVLSARLLADPQRKVTAVNDAFALRLQIPGTAPDPVDSVLAVDIEGAPLEVKIDPYADETVEERDARMRWWREARFGMFIHWGVYAVPAGTYDGKQIGGIGEWIMNRGRIPVARYRKYAGQFNPVKYDPDAWVRLAKEAGMKYIVITSKHHDGFALFDSKVTDWDIVDATPYGKDLLKPLAEACRKHGLKLGFYYSQAQDWTHRGGAGNSWDPTHKGNMTEYIRKIAAPQVREILSNYGDVAVLWWDTPRDMTRERAELLLPLVSLQPGIIYNNRLGGGYKGDTDTPEQHIPATGIAGRDWETCMTMNGTWGYKSYDHNWKSVATLIRNLVDIASKGGNYLLNVGPKADGTIPDPSIERLKAVGQWMKVNGDAIYGTTASPCRRPAWGRVTSKVSDSGAKLFLHVFDWPEDGELRLPLGNPVRACRLLADPSRKCEASTGSRGISVKLTGSAPDPICSVVALEIEGAPQEIAYVIPQEADGRVVLAVSEAKLHGKGLRVENKYDGKPNLGYWLEASDWVQWTFEVNGPGRFEVSAEAAGPAKTHFVLQSGDVKIPVSLAPTGAYENFKKSTLGAIKLEAAGKHTLSMRPTEGKWAAINVRDVTLVPVE